MSVFALDNTMPTPVTRIIGGVEGRGGLPVAVFGACGFTGQLLASYSLETMKSRLNKTIAANCAEDDETSSSQLESNISEASLSRATL